MTEPVVEYPKNTKLYIPVMIHTSFTLYLEDCSFAGGTILFTALKDSSEL